VGARSRVVGGCQLEQLVRQVSQGTCGGHLATDLDCVGVSGTATGLALSFDGLIASVQARRGP
jgi:hypothetical protein